jgi:hypothetical protein
MKLKEKVNTWLFIFTIIFFSFIIITIIIIIIIKIKILFPISNQRKKEGFLSKQLILLGDSILNNSNYVSEDETVENALKMKTSYSILNLAQNEATISMVFYQLEKLSSDNNLSNTYILLSVGGNDLMQFGNFHHTWKQYELLIKSIHSKLPKVTIVILNLYYPLTDKYNQFIRNWNTSLLELVKNNSYLKLVILDKVIHEDDLIETIEPSKYGSEKIAESILSILNKI